LSNQKISIILAPSKGNRSYKVTISREVAWLAVVALGLIVIGLMVSLVMYGRVAVVASRAKSLEQENVKLVEQSRRLLDLQKEVDRLRSMEAKVLALMGIDTLAVGRQRWPEVSSGGATADSAIQVDGLGGFVWPVTGAISRGYRLDRTSGTPHLGLDIAGKAGTPIKAAQAGRVSYAGQDSVYGNMVIISHGGGVASVYGHNASLLVVEGEWVEAGQVIARLGSTGRSSAPHLHFEIREGKSTVDPLKYLQRR
jgi:murein DD-endopeptidase MepM/ murein hydrolase activator NlpD